MERKKGQRKSKENLHLNILLRYNEDISCSLAHVPCLLHRPSDQRLWRNTHPSKHWGAFLSMQGGPIDASDLQCKTHLPTHWRSSTRLPDTHIHVQTTTGNHTLIPFCCCSPSPFLHIHPCIIGSPQPSGLSPPGRRNHDHRAKSRASTEDRAGMRGAAQGRLPTTLEHGRVYGAPQQAAAVCSMPTSPAWGWHLAGLEKQSDQLKSSFFSEGFGQRGDQPSVARLGLGSLETDLHLLGKLLPSQSLADRIAFIDGAFQHLFSPLVLLQVVRFNLFPLRGLW